MSSDPLEERLRSHETLASVPSAEAAGVEPADFAQLLLRPVVRPRFAIPNLAIRGQITTFYAGVGTGKSTLYQEAVVAHETGRAFLGMFEFDEAQRFVVFDWENGDGGEHGGGAPLALKRLGLSDPPTSFAYYFDLDQGAGNLDTDKGRENLAEILTRHEATCAIFDARDAAFPHTSEIEGERIAPAMRACLGLARELDCALVFVSHEPKAEYQDSASKLRGHTAWAQYSEQMFRYVRRGDIRILEHTKNRGIDQREPLRVSLIREGDPDTGPMRFEAQVAESASALEERRTGDVGKVEEFLEELGDRSWSALKDAMAGRGIGEGRLREALKRSVRVWQPGGPRTDYSIRPRDDEDGQLV